MSIDISELLKPINDSLLCGEDYSFSNEFHEIKKARTQDDLLLDQGIGLLNGNRQIGILLRRV